MPIHLFCTVSEK